MFRAWCLILFFFISLLYFSHLIFVFFKNCLNPCCICMGIFSLNVCVLYCTHCHYYTIPLQQTLGQTQPYKLMYRYFFFLIAALWKLHLEIVWHGFIWNYEFSFISFMIYPVISNKLDGQMLQIIVRCVYEEMVLKGESLSSSL